MSRVSDEWKYAKAAEHELALTLRLYQNPGKNLEGIK